MSKATMAQTRFDDPRAFDEWAAKQPGDWELHDGVAVAMAPERADHARIKLQACLALRNALRAQGSRCEAMVGGLMVPGPGARRFKPDVIVSCGDRIAGSDTLVEQPVILVEVLSPSTENADTGLKLESYLALPSVQHYLVVSATARRVVHHRRWQGDQFLTSIWRRGEIHLDPPDIGIRVEDFYEGTDVEG